MSFQIKYQPEVITDIREALVWYEKKQANLRLKFLEHLIEAFKHIKENPYYQVRYADVRCFPLKKFPYMIHFTIDESKKLIVIEAIFHTAKQPKFWKGKSD